MRFRGFLSVVLVLAGIAAVVLGVVYYTVPVHSLPTWFPGHVARFHYKHTTRGEAGIVLGVVLIAIGLVLGFTGRRRRRSRSW